MNWPACCTKLFAVCLMAFSSLASAQTNSSLITASSQDHIWFAVETGRAGGPVSLLQIPVGSATPTYNTIFELPALPEAMAAWKDRLWLIFPPSVGAPDQREVFSLRISYNPTLKKFFAIPNDRLIQESPLPKEGQLVSALGTRQGPVVMLSSAAESYEPGARRTGIPDGQRAIPAVNDVTLLSLQKGTWQELPPFDKASRDDLSGLSGPVFIAVQGKQRDEIIAFIGLEQNQSDAAAAVFTLNDGGDASWSSRIIHLAVDHVQDILTVDGRLMLQEQTPSVGGIGEGKPKIALAYVYADRRLPLIQFDLPSVENWALLGTASGVELLEVLGPGRFMIRHIRTNAMVAVDQENPSVDGAEASIIGPPIELEPASEMGPALWQVTVLSGLMIGLVLLLLLVRPPVAGTGLALSSDLKLMPLSTRFLALLIDFIPGGLAAIVIFDAELADLIRIPSLNLTLVEGLPYLVMVTITVLHEGISEQICRSTLGKAVLGGKVVSLDGGSPSRGRLLIRSLVKWIVLILPVLAIVNILSRLLQGVHDQAAGTLVIRRPRQAKPPLDSQK